MLIKSLLDSLARSLSEAGIADADLEARFMLQHILNCSRTRLFLKMSDPFPDSLSDRLQEMLARRLQREPLAYVLGEWDFRGLTLTVGPEVLIPRPETEQLVDRVAVLVRENVLSAFRQALDVGCGSGAIAVSLLKEKLAEQVIALDVSVPALQVCRQNARRHEVTDRLGLVAADLEWMPFDGQFDLVVANLPYIDTKEIDALMPEVSRFEPRSALDGGGRGEELFCKLAAVLEQILRPGGYVVLEIGADQKNFIIELFQGRQYDSLAVLPDYSGLPRIFSARRLPTAVTQII